MMKFYSTTGLACIMHTYYMHCMITKQDDLLGTLIHDVAHSLRTSIDRQLAPYNLTRVKWLALGILGKNKGITQSELADKMELGVATVGRMTDRMVERGFVERIPHPTDRRAYGLHLTEAAIETIADLDHIADDLRQDALNNISPQDIQTVNRTLLAIKRNLQPILTAAALFGVATANKVASEAVTLSPII